MKDIMDGGSAKKTYLPEEVFFCEGVSAKLTGEFSTPSELLITPRLLKVAELTFCDENINVSAMSDYERFSLCCRTLMYAREVDEVAALEREMALILGDTRLLSKLLEAVSEEERQHVTAELWTALCGALGCISFDIDERKEYDGKYKNISFTVDQRSKNNISEKYNNKKLCILADELVKKDKTTEKSTKSIVEKYIHILENIDELNILLVVNDTEKYNRPNEYLFETIGEKIDRCEEITNDEKYIFISSLLYKICSSNHRGKIQLHLWDKTENKVGRAIIEYLLKLGICPRIRLCVDSPENVSDAVEYCYSFSENARCLPELVCCPDTQDTRAAIALSRLLDKFPRRAVSMLILGI